MAIRTVKQDGTADFTTVQTAVAACATTGDTVRFADNGVYNEAVDTRIGGAWGRAITFDCPGFTPTMSGVGALGHAFKLGTMQTPAAGVLTKFLGLRFTGYDQTGAGQGVIYGNGGQCEAYDCEFASCAGSAFFDLTPSATLPLVIERCRQTGTAGGAFLTYALEGVPTFVNLRSCLANCATGVTAIKIGGTSSTVYNCTVVTRGAGAGIQAASASVDVRNNIVRSVGHNIANGLSLAGLGTHEYNILSGYSVPITAGAAAGTGEFYPLTMTVSGGLQVGETLKRDNGAGATIGTVKAVSGAIVSITPAASGYVPIATDTVYGVTSAVTRVVSTQTPLFTDEAGGDFTIPASSLALNAGTTLGSVVDDLLGTARPQGAAYDLGAYETVLSVSIVDVTVLSPTSIRVNLSGPYATDGTWSDVGNFTITSSDGGAIPTISVATPNADPGSSITLTTGEHTNGRTYDVALAGITGIVNGNAGYTGQGVGPGLTSATPQSATVTRVVFDEPMTNNAALLLASNYAFAPTGGGGDLAPIPVSVAWVNSTTVDVTHSAGLAAKGYDLTIANVQDAALNPTAGDTASYTSPSIGLASIVAVDSTTVRVTFASPVQNSVSLTTPSHYVFTQNSPATGRDLVALKVTPQNDSAPLSVDVTTSPQTFFQSYHLVVSSVLGVT